MSDEAEMLFRTLQKQLEAVGFVFEKEQKPFMQPKRNKELKFVHPVLNHILTKNGKRNLATKYYLKPISDDSDSEIGLIPGGSTLLTQLKYIEAPNAMDTYGPTPAWVNRKSDKCLDRLLVSIGDTVKNDKNLTLANHYDRFDEAVRKSYEDNVEVRRNRLENAPKIPEKFTVNASAYKRNPDVVAEVLMRANGVCEICNEKAPFTRKRDNTPYLEVHHRIQLANGGEDTVSNAVGICPNCHREQHFG